jgi:superoxide dismutase, Fe-Mn family
MTLTRRDMLQGAAAGALLVGAAQVAFADKEPATAAPKGVAAGQHAVKALPFAPGKLTGISEQMIVSHHDNNYAGAVKNLNKVEDELAKVTKDTPGFMVTGLRERELTYTNSLILHEHYFGNLGGDGKPSGAIEKALAAAHGSLARWEELFRATAMGLGGGSGWVVVDLNFHTGDLRTYGSGGHSQALAFGQPLLVLDMFEHAYAMDYGSKAAAYVDAVMAAINWTAVNGRFAGAAA